jgi:hypothetical protein
MFLSCRITAKDLPKGILSNNKGTCIPVFTAALFTIAKLQKQLRCPTTDE